MKKRDSQLLNSKYFKKKLVLKGFEKLTDFDGGKLCEYDAHDFIGYFFEDDTAQNLYEKFQELILSKMGKEYFPIYRMADGEFIFIKNLFLPKLSLKDKIIKVLKNIKILIKPNIMYGRKIKHNYKKELLNLFDTHYFRVAHGESYSSKEFKILQKKFPQQLKEISKRGKLAIHFMEEKNSHGYAEFHEIVFNYLNRIGLSLNAENYTHFYFIYALLNCVERDLLYKGRRILIVTNYTEDKRSRIENSLLEAGAFSVEFMKISETGSMFEILDQNRLEQLKGKINLVLVGAGLGSCNILLQLEVLHTVCIDAGINIECLANPELKNKRIFLNHC